MKFSDKDKIQNLDSVYESHMFLILKNCLVFFSKHTRLFIR